MSITEIDRRVIYLMRQLISEGKSNMHTVNWKQNSSWKFGSTFTECMLKVFTLRDFLCSTSPVLTEAGGKILITLSETGLFT